MGRTRRDRGQSPPPREGVSRERNNLIFRSKPKNRVYSTANDRRAVFYFGPLAPVLSPHPKRILRQKVARDSTHDIHSQKGSPPTTSFSIIPSLRRSAWLRRPSSRLMFSAIARVPGHGRSGHPCSTVSCPRTAAWGAEWIRWYLTTAMRRKMSCSGMIHGPATKMLGSTPMWSPLCRSCATTVAGSRWRCCAVAVTDRLELRRGADAALSRKPSRAVLPPVAWRPPLFHRIKMADRQAHSYEATACLCDCQLGFDPS